MLKQLISFLVLCSTAAALYSQALFLAPVSLRPPLTNNQYALIGQITHTWASTAHSVFQLASSSLYFYCEYTHKWKCVKGLHSDVKISRD